ncbi:MAG: hypothetical protein J0L92_37390, partial [Deltaproteobacteria bacterium]|nr:hypothetical protein [Deltaproteobacteria bacterium]
MLATGMLATGMLATGMLATGMLATGMLATGMLATGMLGAASPRPAEVGGPATGTDAGAAWAAPCPFLFFANVITEGRAGAGRRIITSVCAPLVTDACLSDGLFIEGAFIAGVGIESVGSTTRGGRAGRRSGSLGGGTGAIARTGRSATRASPTISRAPPSA